MRMKGEFNVYQVINDIIWKHLSISYQYSYTSHRNAYERSIQCIPSHQWYHLKAPFHQLPIFLYFTSLCIWKVSSIYTKSLMIPFESMFPSATNILLLYIAMSMKGQFNVYPVINGRLWNHLSISYQYSYTSHRYAYERSLQRIPSHEWYHLKAPFHQLPIFFWFTSLSLWKVSWMYTKS